MGKSIFFDTKTGLPIKRSRIQDDEQEKQENDTEMSALRKKRRSLHDVTSYTRSTRKLGKSIFFDEDGFPIVKTRIQKLQIVGPTENGNNSAATASAERSVGSCKPKNHIFFDVHTGLQIERSEARKDSNTSANVVSKSITENSDIQEPENAPAENLGRKKRRKKRKIRYCDEPFDLPRTIGNLPEEVLRMILKEVSLHDRKSCRLVNRLWYEASCDLAENLRPITVDSENRFSIGKKKISPADFSNSGLRHLHLCFQNSDLELLPKNFWENIGLRIYSLKLENCHIGSQVIGSLIRNCPKLQYLRIFVHFTSNENHDTFCRPESLEDIEIVQKELRTLEFCVASRLNMDQKDGERIFAALFRIFPNIENYTVRILRPSFLIIGDYALNLSHSCELTTSFECSFSKTSLNKIADELQLCLMFSLLFTDKWADSDEMLRVLSTVRLRSVEFHFSALNISNKLRSTLVNFFSSQETLKTVKILPYDTCYTVLKPILFQILDSCCELSELVYCPSRIEDCVQNLMEEEWSTLCSKVSKIKTVSICCFLIDNNSSLRSFSSTDDEENRVFELRDFFGRSLMSLIRNLSHIEHLILKDMVSDYILQTIFKYLTGLKTLDVCLGMNVTRFGFIGHIKFSSGESPDGYRIDRLENLERLVLRQSAEPLDDMIFSRFDLPKLIHLECFLPQQCSLLSYQDLSQKIPLVRTVKFSSAQEVTKLISKLSNFARSAKNLETIAIDYPKDEILPKNAQVIFEACPTLKTLHCNQRTFCCQESTRKVLVKHPDNLVNKHYFFID